MRGILPLLLLASCFSDPVGGGDVGASDDESTTASSSTSTSTATSVAPDSSTGADSSSSSSGPGTESSEPSSGAESGIVEDWALAFTGAGQAVTTPTSAVVLGDQFTVELWFRRTGEASGYIFDGRSPADGDVDHNWYAKIQSSGAATFPGQLVFHVEGAAVLAGPTINALSVDWHHVAIVADDAWVTMYLDGIGVAQVASPAAPALVEAPLRLGAWYLDTMVERLVDVEVDEFRISSSAKYGGDFVPAALAEDADTVVLFPLDEGAGVAAADVASGLVLMLDGVGWSLVSP